jgi:hypothetical protein
MLILVNIQYQPRKITTGSIFAAFSDGINPAKKGVAMPKNIPKR